MPLMHNATGTGTGTAANTKPRQNNDNHNSSNNESDNDDDNDKDKPASSSSSSSSKSTTSNSSSSSSSSSSESTDPHNTQWDQVRMSRFLVFLCTFSTIETAAFYPLFVLKTREQSDRVAMSPWQSFKHHLKGAMSTPHGIRNIYRGFWFSCGINLPSYGAYMAV
jgi:hypothetical protein